MRCFPKLLAVTAIISVSDFSAAFSVSVLGGSMTDRIQFLWSVALISWVVVFWCFQGVDENKSQNARLKLSANYSQVGDDLLPRIRRSFLIEK